MFCTYEENTEHVNSPSFKPRIMLFGKHTDKSFCVRKNDFYEHSECPVQNSIADTTEKSLSLNHPNLNGKLCVLLYSWGMYVGLWSVLASTVSVQSVYRWVGPVSVRCHTACSPFQFTPRGFFPMKWSRKCRGPESTKYFYPHFPIHEGFWTHGFEVGMKPNLLKKKNKNLVSLIAKYHQYIAWSQLRKKKHV